ncbi:sugar O-acetyltransferase [Marinomonas algicola]|jgi:maltose O-acetyltransferase|uniref:sugar O-acetyltransferase n=1 Tax=Marinomonas algicola TaxID=2773454 RepID=UPI001747FC5D|nr:sugar O-acetyltransferase [Marinomonas algicola]
MTEYEKMLAGEPYSSLDITLRLMREKARLACAKYNAHPSKGNLKHITRLFAGHGTLMLEPGFQCDYGAHITVGENFYANFNCVLLDSNSIHIGNNVLLGPAVHIYTVDHPRDVNERVAGHCFTKKVTIEDNVWIGGGAKIFPGVTIGEGAIIGANVLVRKDIPKNMRFYG